ncbi:MAG TPA: hypothetical protein P5552_17405 [Candidatus Competibacteraceae bacterium]|nr:hypothetical protein [Candidatus Competibacteraceae bacterium]
MVDTTVKYFSSTMSGAPALSGTAGTLIGVLDACLVNGFGSVTLDSLVVASNVATGTVSAGHNFAMVGNTGPVITIAGATPAGLNGEWRIASIPGSTTFTFATTGISDQTATRTNSEVPITAKRAPGGFEKAYFDTNKAVYRSLNLQGCRLFLRIDDTGTTSAQARMYEAMTSVNDGTGATPAADMTVSKSSASTARAWGLVTDGRLFYFFNGHTGNDYLTCLVFGDIIDFSAANAYGSWLLVSTTNPSTSLCRLSTNAYSFIARNYTQSGSYISSYLYSHNISGGTQYMGSAGSPVPNPVNNSIHFWPVEIWEGGAQARGIPPGLWNPVHAGLSAHATYTDIPQLPNRTLMIFIQGSSYRCAIDLTGPWR